MMSLNVRTNTRVGNGMCFNADAMRYDMRCEGTRQGIEPQKWNGRWGI